MEYKLGEIEMKFADLIWDNEPITSGELAKRCEAALHWKNPRHTPYCGGCATGDCSAMTMAQ